MDIFERISDIIKTKFNKRHAAAISILVMSTVLCGYAPVSNEVDFTICFAGDVNLAENYGTTKLIDSQPNGILDCIDAGLVSHMQKADLMILNNEFTYSDRGAPLSGKKYTFRANPDRVKNLNKLGVDAVYLANNHVYDYGADAMQDTFSTLDSAKIEYFGAGENLNRAMKPYIVEIDGVKVAFVAASRAEKFKMTPQATASSPGILRCYDTSLFKEAIKNASSQADITVAVVHWGTEYSTVLEEVQLKSAREYVEAGADVIIGAHSHCLQGMEMIGEVPVFYSLGNYWFNDKTLDTMLVELHVKTDKQTQTPKISAQIIPGVQENWYTRAASSEKEKERIFKALEDISVNVTIDNNGYIMQSPKN